MKSRREMVFISVMKTILDEKPKRNGLHKCDEDHFERKAEEKWSS
ncbi:hypothetical protein [Neobacillus mesonae]|nr:hypothetical protein [Neobacillus mesonae]